MQQQEDLLLASMQQLSVRNHPAGLVEPIPTTDEGSQIDRARRMVAHVGDVKDQISSISIEVLSVGLAPARTTVRHEIIQDNLSQLQSLLSRLIEHENKLKMIGEHSRQPSVVTLLTEATAEMQDVVELVQRFSNSWQLLLDELYAKREADLSRGCTEYDSGESCR